MPYTLMRDFAAHPFAQLLYLCGERVVAHRGKTVNCRQLGAGRRWHRGCFLCHLQWRPTARYVQLH